MACYLTLFIADTRFRRWDTAWPAAVDFRRRAPEWFAGFRGLLAGLAVIGAIVWLPYVLVSFIAAGSPALGIRNMVSVYSPRMTEGEKIFWESVLTASGVSVSSSCFFVPAVLLASLACVGRLVPAPVAPLLFLLTFCPQASVPARQRATASQHVLKHGRQRP